MSDRAGARRGVRPAGSALPHLRTGFMAARQSAVPGPRPTMRPNWLVGNRRRPCVAGPLYRGRQLDETVASPSRVTGAQNPPRLPHPLSLNLFRGEHRSVTTDLLAARTILPGKQVVLGHTALIGTLCPTAAVRKAATPECEAGEPHLAGPVFPPAEEKGTSCLLLDQLTPQARCGWCSPSWVRYWHWRWPRSERRRPARDIYHYGSPGPACTATRRR